MGIVVCITMLLGLLAFVRNWRHSAEDKVETGWLDDFIGSAPMLLLAMGFWNAAWYGLRHLGSFWGTAALLSSIVMLMAGFILLIESKTQPPPALLPVYQKLKLLRLPVFIALTTGFLLYAVTLIQLNLGYAIIH